VQLFASTTAAAAVGWFCHRLRGLTTPVTPVCGKAGRSAACDYDASIVAGTRVLLIYKVICVPTQILKQHDFNASPSSALTLGHFGAANGGQLNVGPTQGPRRHCRSQLLAGWPIMNSPISTGSLEHRPRNSVSRANHYADQPSFGVLVATAKDRPNSRSGFTFDRYSSPSSCRSVMYLTMTSDVTCGMSVQGLIFAFCTAERNRSVGAIDPRIGVSGRW
jgi:hypothetical protein